MLDAQQGATDSYPDLLRWAAERARCGGASEADVQQALMLIDRLRHTYDPRRCPQRWIDGILRAAGTCVS